MKIVPYFGRSYIRFSHIFFLLLDFVLQKLYNFQGRPRKRGNEHHKSWCQSIICCELCFDILIRWITWKLNCVCPDMPCVSNTLNPLVSQWKWSFYNNRNILSLSLTIIIFETVFSAYFNKIFIILPRFNEKKKRWRKMDIDRAVLMPHPFLSLHDTHRMWWSPCIDDYHSNMDWQLSHLQSSTRWQVAIVPTIDFRQEIEILSWNKNIEDDSYRTNWPSCLEKFYFLYCENLNRIQSIFLYDLTNSLFEKYNHFLL